MRLRSELVASDITDQEIARRVRSGDLERIRRGAYAMPRPATPEERHLDLLRASLGQTRGPGAVASHVSAAVLHGLPISMHRLAQTHLMREGPSRSSVRGRVWRHHRPVLEAILVGGLPATSLTTTTLDLVRWLPFDEAVAVADVAIRTASRTHLLTALEASTGQRGVRRARRAIEFADPRSGSPGESRSRALMTDLGLPMPSGLQFRVADREGEMWTDFVWEEHRVVGEFDGAVKYGRLLKPGQDVSEVVLREKHREQRLRRKQWWTVRWVWRDLHRPHDFAQIITESLSYWDRSR